MLIGFYKQRHWVVLEFNQFSFLNLDFLLFCLGLSILRFDDFSFEMIFADTLSAGVLLLRIWVPTTLGIVSAILISSVRMPVFLYHLLWNSSTSCLLVMTNAFKDSVRWKPSHMSILLDCNSCDTSKVISSTLLVNTKQATN